MQHAIQTKEDSAADENISDIIQAECKRLLSKSVCESNKNCFWDDDKYGQVPICKRNGVTVTADEQAEMFNAMIAKMPAAVDVKPPQNRSSHNYTDFVVTEVQLDDPKLESLDETHFLKQRKIQALSPAETAERLLRRKTSLSTYDIVRRDIYPLNYFTDKENFANLEEDKYVERINKLPIFLYAGEYPVEVHSPDQYKGLIGTVSFMPDDDVKNPYPVKKPYPMIYLPDPENPGKEVQLNANISFGLWIGGKRTRNVRKRKFGSRKHNGCKLRKRGHTKYTRHTRHTRHTRPRK